MQKSTPLLFPTIAIVMSIIIGRYFPYPWIWLTVSAIAAAALFIAKRPTGAIIAASFTIGLGSLMASSPHDISDPREQSLEGVVYDVKEGESSRHILVSTRSGRVYITTPSFLPDVTAGDSVRFTGVLTPPEVKEDIPDVPSLENFYYINRIAATSFIVPDSLKVIGQSDGLYWRLRRLNGKMADKLLQSPLDGGASALLAATILGDRSHLDPESNATFSSAGIAHLLAVSGMHAALIGLLVGIGLWPLAAMGHRAIMIVISLSVLWLYAVLVGLPSSVVRSVTMASLVGGAYLLQRSHSSFNALCFACLLILVFTPRALFAVGFQLSFTAVAGILIWMRIFRDLEIKKGWLRRLISIVALPLAAMLATGIISTFYFHRLPLLFLLSNVPIGIIFPWFMGAGVMWFIIGGIGLPTGWLDTIINAMYDAIAWLSSSIASLPFSTVEGLYFSPWAIPLWCVTLGSLCLWCIKKRQAYAYWALLALVGTIVVVMIPPRQVHPEYYLTSNKQRVEILINDGTGCSVGVLMPNPHLELDSSITKLYADYAGYRRIGLPTIHAISPGIMDIGSDRWLIMTDAADTLSAHPSPDYVLIARGFKGDVVEVAQRYPESKIVLSSTLNGRRHRRYIDELHNEGCQYMSSREEALRFTLH